MIHKIFTVFDEKVGSYLQPFFLPATGAATRAITDLVNQPDHNFHKYAADFTLFEIGTFDDESCTFQSITQINLGCLIGYKNDYEPPLPFNAPQTVKA